MTTLAERVALRGFPTRAIVGGTGDGALESQGSTTRPEHGQATNDPGSHQTISQAYEPDTVAAVPLDVPVLDQTFGLGGDFNPDQTPDDHAAPYPGWAGSYDSPDLDAVHVNSAIIHAQDFGALVRHTTVIGVQGGEPIYDQWSSINRGESVQQEVSGQLQAMGGRDAVQGYDLRNGYDFDAGHRSRTTAQSDHMMAYLDPAERPAVWPQGAGSFIPQDNVQGPAGWASFRSGDGLSYTPPSPYTPAPDPATLTDPQAGAAASSGWWG